MTGQQQQQLSQAVRGHQTSSEPGPSLSPPLTFTERDNNIPHTQQQQQQPAAPLSQARPDQARPGQTRPDLEMLKFHLPGPRPAGGHQSPVLPPLQKPEQHLQDKRRISLLSLITLSNVTLGPLVRSSSTSDLIFVFLASRCPGWTNFTNIELYRL